MLNSISQVQQKQPKISTIATASYYFKELFKDNISNKIEIFQLKTICKEIMSLKWRFLVVWKIHNMKRAADRFLCIHRTNQPIW